MKYIIHFQRNISRILFHILIKYIYIYIYSFHIFYHAYDISSSFVHKHTHTPPKNKILFFLHPDTRKGFVSKLFIHYKNFKKKKKTKKQNKFEKHFFSLDLLSEEYYLTLENFQQMKMLLKKKCPFEVKNFIDAIPRTIFRKQQMYKYISQKRF